MPGLTNFVNILLWSNTVFIITRYGLHGKPASYIYTGAVISSNSMGLQNSASRLAKPTSRSTMAGIMYLKNLIIYFKFYFDFIYADIILRLTVQPRWHFKIFILQKILWKVHHPKKAQVAVVMHEGILRSRVSASLLQGNTVPKTRSLFFKGEAV